VTGTEIPLAGGNMSGGVVRVGDTVRRPAGPWTPAVRALLTHLHEAGFRGAPLMADAYGLTERERLDIIPLLARRTRAMHAFLAREAARGTQPWARLWQEGHGDTWDADTRYIARREGQWHQALLG
jgi:hypothetical protein